MAIKYAWKGAVGANDGSSLANAWSTEAALAANFNPGAVDDLIWIGDTTTPGSGIPRTWGPVAFANTISNADIYCYGVVIDANGDVAGITAAGGNARINPRGEGHLTVICRNGTSFPNAIDMPINNGEFWNIFIKGIGTTVHIGIVGANGATYSNIAIDNLQEYGFSGAGDPYTVQNCTVNALRGPGFRPGFSEGAGTPTYRDCCATNCEGIGFYNCTTLRCNAFGNGTNFQATSDTDPTSIDPAYADATNWNLTITAPALLPGGASPGRFEGSLTPWARGAMLFGLAHTIGSYTAPAGWGWTIINGANGLGSWTSDGNSAWDSTHLRWDLTVGTPITSEVETPAPGVTMGGGGNSLDWVQAVGKFDISGGGGSPQIDSNAADLLTDFRYTVGSPAADPSAGTLLRFGIDAATALEDQARFSFVIRGNNFMDEFGTLNCVLLSWDGTGGGGPTAPTIANLSPSSGSTAGGESVVITGTDFTGATMVEFGLGNSAGFVVDSPTQITATTPAHAAGVVDVIVTTPGGSNPNTAADDFTYSASPAVASIVPPCGLVAGGETVTINGSNFSVGDTAVLIGGQAATSVNVTGPGTLTCVTPSVNQPGFVDVRVTTPSGTSPNGPSDDFEYMLPVQLDAINPAVGDIAGGETVTITGEGFGTNTIVEIGGAGLIGQIVESQARITGSTPAGATGAKTVTVTNPCSSAQLVGGFTYEDRYPSLASVTPSSGPKAGGTPVTISGTGFELTDVVFVGGTPLLNQVVVNATTITGDTPASTEVGYVEVAVVDADGSSSSIPNGFTYQGGPIITNLNPAIGTHAGGETINLSGFNFEGGMDVQFDGISSPSVQVIDRSRATAVTPARPVVAPADEAYVNVLAADGYGENEVLNAFRYYRVRRV